MMVDEKIMVHTRVKSQLPGNSSIARKTKSDQQLLLISQGLWLVVLAVLVALIVIITHWPVLSAQATSLDDQQYLTNNVLVKNPSWESARRFLSEVTNPSSVEGYYQPLTMISLMWDYAASGRADDLTRYHQTNLTLHVFNTVFVMMLIYMLFGRLWAAAAVGLVFGLHPTSVESIAWIAQRKSLLAVFFSLMGLIGYVRYVRRGRGYVYGVCLVTFILALMSKPTSVPLPLLMLVLDYWPLNRLNKRAVIEKIPFFVLSLIFAFITVKSQEQTAKVVMPYDYGMMKVILVVCHNIIVYLYKIVLPSGLSLYYAFPQDPLRVTMMWVGLVGTSILTGLLTVSLRWTRALSSGCLFFFMAIFPALGVIGFTNVIVADRFIYLPIVGLLLIMAAFLIWLWDGTQRYSRKGLLQVLICVGVVAAVGIEILLTRTALGYWQDRETLLKGMLQMAPQETELHINYGVYLQNHKRNDEAIRHYQKVLSLNPGNPKAHNNMGNIMMEQGKYDKAIDHFKQAVASKPDYDNAYLNWGLVHARKKEYDQAIVLFNKTLELNKDNVKAHYNLALALAQTDRHDESVQHFRECIRYNFKPADSYFSIGLNRFQEEEYQKAIDAFKNALRINRHYPSARQQMAES